MSEIIGMIGLGLMGGAMARNLVAAGYTVVGFDSNAAAAETARAANIQFANNVAEVATKARDIILSLPDPDAVLVTAQAVIEAGVPRCVLIETSTLDLNDKLRFEAMLSAAGHVPLDCPLSGTSAQAINRYLAILASGADVEIERLEPVFMAIGRKAFSLGEFGNGTRMKLIANLLVAIHNVASGEAMALAKKAGLDPHQVVDVITAGAGTSRIFELRAPMMADNRYEPPTMRQSTWQKDMAAISAFAASLDCSATLSCATEPIYEAAVRAGRDGEDTASVCAVIEAMNS
jgi:putative dehydrogenase